MKRPPVKTATAAPAPAPGNELRDIVRQILAAMPMGRAATIRFIKDQVNRTTPHVCDEAMVQAAINWNHDRGLVDFRFNRTMEWDEWFLTERGQTKEGLK